VTNHSILDEIPEVVRDKVQRASESANDMAEGAHGHVAQVA
jgi:hypothetical protein